MSKILVVEDEELLCMQIADVLGAQQFLVDTALSELDARTYLKAGRYSLIILDWELPDGSGLDLCRQIRSSAHADVAILFLTARGGILDKLEGFNSGADDYLSKPFHMIELIARVKALLKRPPVVQSRQLRARNIVMDTDRHEVFVDGVKVELFPKEYSLLEFLMSNPNKIFSADDLLRRIWPTESQSSPETVRVTLMRIRQKLDQNLANDRPLIVTLKNIGYRLEP